MKTLFTAMALLLALTASAQLTASARVGVTSKGPLNFAASADLGWKFYILTKNDYEFRPTVGMSYQYEAGFSSSYGPRVGLGIGSQVEVFGGMTFNKSLHKELLLQDRQPMFGVTYKARPLVVDLRYMAAGIVLTVGVGL